MDDIVRQAIAKWPNVPHCYGWLGLDMKYGLLQQNETMPVSLALRGAYTKTLYVEDMDMHALTADVTAGRTGRAFIVSAMTATAGVGVIATSSLPLLRDFGIIVALNVAVALLSAPVFLPPMLVWADERRWVSRGLVPSEVLDRATLEHDTPQVKGPPRHPHVPEADPA